MRGIFQNFRSFDACTAEQIDRIETALCDGESPARLSARLLADGIRISADTLRRQRAELYLMDQIVRAREKRDAARMRLLLESTGVTPVPDSVASNVARPATTSPQPGHPAGA